MTYGHLRQWTGKEPIHVNIKRRRWKWIEHSLRMEHTTACSAPDWNPQGKYTRMTKEHLASWPTE